jgi:tetratricopeptide (TPR) repeat protein
MALDPYAACSCGSGKKFRWCCEPLYKDIHRAREQEANGQHDAAGRILDELTAAHPQNPQAWGERAEFLYRHGKVEEAEADLEKAFALSPNYPFGLLLRAVFRFQEGEIPGALLLARRAAEAYDPQAHDYLAQLYAIIFQCEMALNRPVAARAALRRVLHLQPADEQARERFTALFGETSRLPESARREYTFLSPPAGTAGPRRAAWDAALGEMTGGQLGELARAFERLAAEDEADAAAWYDLGLTRAWLGDNGGAVDALDRYLEREPDEARATEAAALQEVLRCGAGMEDQSDYQEYAFLHQIRDPNPVNALLQDWGRARRLLPLQTSQEGTFVALVLEMTTSTLVTAGGPAADAGRFAGYLLIAGDLLQVTSPLKEAFDRLRAEVRERLALGLADLPERRGPAQFQDVVADALLFPVGGTEEQVREKVLAHFQRYYEETWIHRPRKALAGNAPVDAAGHPTLRKKLRGVIQFTQECARLGMVAAYDFDRLRRKLGLLGAPAPASGAAGPAAGADIGAMGAAELAALPPERLSAEQLEQAWQAALKLDAQELGARFARVLTAQPPAPGRGDRFPVYNYLTQRALQEGDTGAALGLVDEGERVDCEHNEGRRRDDYELRRGQVHVKRGEADAAHDVFRRLVERSPANLRYRGSAAEAMLSLRQGARALDFAEGGLAAARRQNDRDSEQYLQELAAAARKQMG